MKDTGSNETFRRTAWRVVVLTLFALSAALPWRAAAAQDRGYATFVGIDIAGGDIGSVSGSSRRHCMRSCSAVEGCVAFTLNERHGLCFLKHSVTMAVSHPAAYSGVLVQADARLRASVNGYDLNVRAGPGLGASVVSVLPNRTR